MSSPGFSVDPSALGASGLELSGVAGEFASALRAFQAELSGFGTPWGADEIGSLIGAAHEEVAQWAFECFEAAAEELEAAGFDVGAMATSYREVEEQIRGAFDAFGG
ncbi:PE family protein [Asanoa hainanensis]|uniref:PE family protein n=1 Tax=Asanoa hainanensis TaxID=560556 RepID=A0A239IUI0_9ACTN|nr:PE domain-containing protein [Asanoa hainanensis]SNS97229.1 PE family protein [Asanoa hainanensis]